MLTGWVQDRVKTIWADVCTAEGRDVVLPHVLTEVVSALRPGQTVLVHCVRGRHRTGAVLGTVKALST